MEHQAIILVQPSSAFSLAGTATSLASISDSAYGVSNAAVIGTTAAAVSLTVLLLLAGVFLLRRRSVTERGKRQPNIALKTCNTFIISMVVAVITALATCLLASKRSWQDSLVQRWDSSSSVLRVIQVLAFVLRLPTTYLGWTLMADLGWLLLKAGGSPRQMIGALNIALTGGGYSLVGSPRLDGPRRLTEA